MLNVQQKRQESIIHGKIFTEGSRPSIENRSSSSTVAPPAVLLNDEIHLGIRDYFALHIHIYKYVLFNMGGEVVESPLE